MTPGEGYLFAAQIILDELDIHSISPKRLGEIMNVSFQKASVLLRGLGWVRFCAREKVWYERSDLVRIVCNPAKAAGKRIARRALEVLA